MANCGACLIIVLHAVLLLFVSENNCQRTAECGDFIFLDEEETTVRLTSENQHQLRNDACLWYIRSPPGTTIRLDVLHHLSDVWGSDSFAVFDGMETESGHRIVLGGNSDSHFRSAGNAITCQLLMESDQLLPEKSGMVLGVTLENNISVDAAVSGQCGGTITLTQETSTAKFNASNAFCNWYISSPPHTLLIVTFRQVQLGDDDYLLIYDSRNRLIFQVANLDISPYPVYLDSNYTRCNFDPNFSVSDSFVSIEVSFTDQYRPNDDGVLLSSAGVIVLNDTTPTLTLRSPNLTSSNDVFMRAYWYVTSSPGTHVKVAYHDLHTGEYVYMHVFDSFDTSRTISSFSDPDIHISDNVFTTNAATFRLDSTLEDPGSGLFFTVSITDASPTVGSQSCGGSITLSDSLPNVTFNSPYYHQQPSLNGRFTCRWFVTSPLGKQVKLTLMDVDTAFYEEVAIYDHPSSPSYRVSLFRGDIDVNISPFVSSRGGLILYFQDFNTGYNGPGFLVDVGISVASPTVGPKSCGGTIMLSDSLPNVTFNSPYYHQSFSYDYIDCWWYVTSPSGRQVKLTLMDVETTLYEYLTIYDHPSSTSRNYQVSSLRGDIYVNASPLVSTRGGLTVVLDDRSSADNGRGFLVHVSISDEFTWNDDVINSCGQSVHLDFSSPSILFSTPTYPNEILYDYHQCFWYFTSPTGTRLVIEFLDFDIYTNSYFYLTDDLYYDSSYRLSQVSSKSVPGNGRVQSSSNRLTAKYDDNDWSDSVFQRGTLANVSLVEIDAPTWESTDVMSSCGSAVKLDRSFPSLTLTTPDYHNVIGDYFICVWFVKSPSKSTTEVRFLDFGLDGSAYLQVHDGPSTSSGTLLHASGTSLPSPVTSTNNAMTIYYYSRRETSGLGVKFVVSGIFEELTSSSDPTLLTSTLSLEPPTSSPDANIICESTSMTVLLHKEILDNDGVPGDVHFEDNHCIGYNHDRQHIALHTRYDNCRTAFEETDSAIVFSNVVTYYNPKPINNSNITREAKLQIPVRCVLNRHQLLGSSFNPVIGTIVFSEEGYGNFSLSLDRYTDDTFSEFPIDEEAEVTLGKPLYFAVNLTSVPVLTVFIENCWATPSPYPLDVKQYHLIDRGCKSDDTLQYYSNFGITFKPFAVDAFAFIGEYPQVYLHCEVLVCADSDINSRCAQGCVSRARRGGRQTRGSGSDTHVISNGPISSYNSKTNVQSQDGRTLGLTLIVMIASLLGITCLLVIVTAMLAYMKLSRRFASQGYQRVENDPSVE